MIMRADKKGDLHGVVSTSNTGAHSDRLGVHPQPARMIRSHYSNGNCVSRRRPGSGRYDPHQYLMSYRSWWTSPQVGHLKPKRHINLAIQVERSEWAYKSTSSRPLEKRKYSWHRASHDFGTHVPQNFDIFFNGRLPSPDNYYSYMT
jgi:hypothetical protein